MVVYYFNTDFELKMEGILNPPKQVYEHELLALQIAGEDDLVAVTEMPNNPDPRLILRRRAKLSGARVIPWGHAPEVAEWATDHGGCYEHPPFEVVRQITDKLFAFERGPKLPGAHLIHEGDPIPPEGLLKSRFGVAGRGNHHIQDAEKALNFAKKKGWPLIWEPWVEGGSEYSTHWMIGDEIIFRGCTTFKVNGRGSFMGVTGTREPPEEHLTAATDILREIKELGYFGPVSVDAMPGHVIMEINPRYTMASLSIYP